MAKNILIVDKNPAVQKLFEFVLFREGFQVLPFLDGPSALNSAFETDPILIVVDSHMEGMNLSQFIEKMRQHQTLKKVPIVLLANPEDTHEEIQTWLMDIVDIIKKPLDPIRLLEKIKMHVARFEINHVVASLNPATDAPAKENMQAEDTMTIEQLLATSFSSEEHSDHKMQKGKNQEGVDLRTEMRIEAPASENACDPLKEDIGEIIASDENDSQTQTQTQTQAQAPEKKQSKLGKALMIAPFSISISAESPCSTEKAITPLPPKSEHKTKGQTSSPPGSEQAKNSPADHGAEMTTRQVVEETVRRMAQEVVEKVTWDVTLQRNPPTDKIQQLPEVMVYNITSWDAETIIRSEGLVFINGQYSGRSLTVERLLEDNLIARGLTKKDFARYGVIPQAVEKSSVENMNREIWVYKYRDSNQAKMKLNMLFIDGRIDDWSIQEDIPTYKYFFLNQEWKDFSRKVEADVEKGLLSCMEAEILLQNKFYEKLLALNKGRIRGESIS